MRRADADELTRTNLAYREPALYDGMLRDSALATQILDLAARIGNPVRTALDLGCGTGRLLADLFGRGTTGAGIDLQPGLISWARREHPALWLEVGDLRTARLGTTFDLITCVGNTLSYLHTEPDLAAALTTAAVHARPGTLLAVATLTGTGRDGAATSEIGTLLGPATVSVHSAWSPTDHVLTTTRTWRFAEGRIERDTMRRRVWTVELVDRYARAVGFRPVPADHPELTYCAAFAP